MLDLIYTQSTLKLETGGHLSLGCHRTLHFCCQHTINQVKLDINFLDEMVQYVKQNILQRVLNGGNVKVKESRNRPGVAHRVQGGLGSWIS
jgi:hypothetical protein